MNNSRYLMFSIIALLLFSISPINAITINIVTPDTFTSPTNQYPSSLNSNGTWGFSQLPTGSGGVVNNYYSSGGILCNSDYLVFVNSTGYYAQNCKTSIIDYSGVNGTIVVQNTVQNGGTISFGAGTFILKNIVITKPTIINGMGIDTTILSLPSDSSSSKLLILTNTVQSFNQINLNVIQKEGNNLVTLPTGAGNNFKAGQYVLIHDGSASIPHTQINRIAAISNDLLFLSDPLGDSYLSTNNSTIKQVSLTPFIKISNLSLTNGNNTGLSFGIFGTYLLSPMFENLKISGFSASGLLLSLSYYPTVNNIIFEKDATSGGGYADFETSLGTTHLLANNVNSYYAGNGKPGFGPTFSGLHFSNLNNVVSNFAGGRGFKLFVSSYNTLTNPMVFNSRPGETGLSITVDSHNNIITNPISMGNSLGLAIFDGNILANSRNNIIIGGQIMNNTSGPNPSDIYNGNTGDIVSNNKIYGVNFGTLHNYGKNQILIR